MSSKVLIVDDTRVMRNLMKDILTASGDCQVIGEATNGKEAIEQYTKLQPDIVVIDIVMPVMDGIEATKEILKMDPLARIVTCSAVGQESLVMESIAAGARDFILKPFAAERVLKVIRQVLDHV